MLSDNTDAHSSTWVRRQLGHVRSAAGFATTLLIIAALQLGDCASTATALSTGRAMERNPFGAELIERFGSGAYAIKLALIGAVLVAMWHYRQRPWARPLATLVLLGTAWTVDANIHWLLTNPT